MADDALQVAVEAQVAASAESTELTAPAAPAAAAPAALSAVTAPTPAATLVPVVTPTPEPVIVVPAVVPAAAPAAPAVPDHELRGQAALARVPVQPAALGFTISFEPVRPGFGGLTWPQRNHIDIFVNPSWSNAHLLHVVAHEIGHALDLARNSRSDHDAWKALRGMDPTTTWWAGPYTSDFASPSGDFAECFAAWAVGSGLTRSHFGSCAGTEALMSQLVAG